MSMNMTIKREFKPEEPIYFYRCLTSRSIIEMNERTTLKMESNLMDLNEKFSSTKDKKYEI